MAVCVCICCKFSIYIKKKKKTIHKSRFDKEAVKAKVIREAKQKG